MRRAWRNPAGPTAEDDAALDNAPINWANDHRAGELQRLHHLRAETIRLFQDQSYLLDNSENAERIARSTQIDLRDRLLLISHSIDRLEAMNAREVLRGSEPPP